MVDKPTTANGYGGRTVHLIKSTCLYIATKLGDMMDEVVVVGGLVPSLLIDQEKLPPGVDAHAGTMDLDIGLALALLDERRYQTLTERLQRAGFSQDRNERGKLTRQRWMINKAEKITVDFLIQPSLPNDESGKLRNMESHFAAMITDGLQLAFQDRISISISGQTIMGERATRDVWVCGPGAFVVLKALAFESRGENKDAYDLFYLIRNFQLGIEGIANRLKPLLTDPFAQKACAVLNRNFLEHDGVGPRRVAEFIVGHDDENVQADVVGYIRRLLEICGKLSPKRSG